jgi:hypothetical protein
MQRCEATVEALLDKAFGRFAPAAGKALCGARMDLQQKKAVITRFIGKCNEYADGKLAQYRAALAGASAAEALAIQDKIGHWTAYRAFNEHTLRELETADLDEWVR